MVESSSLLAQNFIIKRFQILYYFAMVYNVLECDFPRRKSHFKSFLCHRCIASSCCLCCHVVGLYVGEISFQCAHLWCVFRDFGIQFLYINFHFALVCVCIRANALEWGHDNLEFFQNTFNFHRIIFGPHTWCNSPIALHTSSTRNLLAGIYFMDFDEWKSYSSCIICWYKYTKMNYTNGMCRNGRALLWTMFLVLSDSKNSLCKMF